MMVTQMHDIRQFVKFLIRSISASTAAPSPSLSRKFRVKRKSNAEPTSIDQGVVFDVAVSTEKEQTDNLVNFSETDDVLDCDDIEEHLRNQLKSTPLFDVNKQHARSDFWMYHTRSEIFASKSHFLRILLVETDLTPFAESPVAQKKIEAWLVGARRHSSVDCYAIAQLISLMLDNASAHSDNHHIPIAWCALAAAEESYDVDEAIVLAALSVVSGLLKAADSSEYHEEDRRKFKSLADNWVSSLYYVFLLPVHHLQHINTWSVLTVDCKEIMAGGKRKVAHNSPNAPDITKKRTLTGEPSLVVCRSIPMLNGRQEDKQIVETWSLLTKPLALKGSRINISSVSFILESEFPWCEDAIDAILGDVSLRLRSGRPWAHFRPTFLVGPPGTGKSRLAKRLASLLGCGYGEVGAGGSSDNRSLAGTARGWSSAHPSFVFNVMRTSSSANPIILVDELDKAGGSDRNGSIKDTLLGMIEPTTSQSWVCATRLL